MLMASTIQVSSREAATAYGVSPRTIRRWAQIGRLDAVKVGGRWQIAATADLDGFKPAQVDKARELIEQAAILPTKRQGLFTAVSSDGTTTYLVHANGCTCPAGQRGKHLCYHRAAVAILTAVPSRLAA
jgi:excisionase family DNA binding protein